MCLLRELVKMTLDRYFDITLEYTKKEKKCVGEEIPE